MLPSPHVPEANRITTHKQEGNKQKEAATDKLRAAETVTTRSQITRDENPNRPLRSRWQASQGATYICTMTKDVIIYSWRTKCSQSLACLKKSQERAVAFINKGGKDQHDSKIHQRRKEAEER